MLLQNDGFKEKRNVKSPEMSLPRNYSIPNHDITIIFTQQDPILPPILSKGLTGNKQFIDDSHFSNKKEN